MKMANFIETYRGLATIEETGLLTKTQSQLVLRLISQLNKLITTGKNKGVIDLAIEDYVRQYVSDNSNRDFGKHELDQLLKQAKDIGLVEANAFDLSGSTDTILALMDKLFKRKRQEILDKVDFRNDEIRRLGSKLLKLTDGKEVDYSFMLQYDSSGQFSGRYIQEIGYDYWRSRADLRTNLFDTDGNWKEYVFIEDLSDAREIDIEHNKSLYVAKKKYGEFLSAERRGKNGVVDGEYHRYTDEFKRERSKYQSYKNRGSGYWERKRGVSDLAYNRFINKYFIERPTHFAILKDGNFTGQTRVDEKPFPKQEYVEIRSITSSGRDMRDPKYIKINAPKDALGEAQKEFYFMFKRMFEDELLTKLPLTVRDSMLGKVPLVQSTLYDSLKDKPNIIANLWGKASRGVTNLVTTTGTMRKVMTDINGNFIDTLPIFYVGNPRSDEALEKIEIEIQELKKSYNEGDLSIEEYKTRKDELIGQRARIQNVPSRDELSTNMADSLLRFSGMAENYEVMGGVEDTYKAMLKVLEQRTYTSSRGTKLVSQVKGVMEQVGIPGISNSGEAMTVRRAKKWMKMVYYNNDKMTRDVWDKITSGLIRYSSLSYVAFNPFGNINNYVIARINNGIENLGGIHGGRFWEREAYTRATMEFNKRALPDTVRAFAYSQQNEEFKKLNKYVTQSKYEAFVDFFRMMDSKADIRESGQSAKREGWLKRKLDLGYLLQDAAEYNVQTKVGMAIVMSKMLKNSKTGKELAIYDAYTFNGDGSLTLKEGFDTYITPTGKEIPWTDQQRYDVRNNIREVNKQIHGNYAHEDRMAIQSNALGELAAQFHKWTVPAIKARFRPEYFDENVGWMEGRYLSFLKFMLYSMKNLGEIGNWSRNFTEQYKKEDATGQKGKMKTIGAYRTMAEIGIMFSTYMITQLLSGLLEDDDDDSVIQKRFENALIYQGDRAYKEMVMYMPTPTGLKQMAQMAKTPLASTRTLGEVGEALEATASFLYGISFERDGFYRNSEYVYQRKPKEGQIKVVDQWMDAIPILYGIQRWSGYDRQKSFFIK